MNQLSPEACGTSSSSSSSCTVLYADYSVVLVLLLSLLQAAPLMCAGVTVFNALRHNARPAGSLVAVQVTVNFTLLQFVYLLLCVRSMKQCITSCSFGACRELHCTVISHAVS
jgi:hypothetical protein